MIRESEKPCLALLNGKDFANPKSFGGCPAGVPGYLKLFEWSLIEHIFLSFLLSSSPPPRIYSSKYYSPFLLFFFISSKRNLFIIILLFFSTTFAPHFPSNFFYLFFLLRCSSALQTNNTIKAGGSTKRAQNVGWSGWVDGWIPLRLLWLLEHLWC